jgi:hypothetical protein
VGGTAAGRLGTEATVADTRCRLEAASRLGARRRHGCGGRRWRLVAASKARCRWQAPKLSAGRALGAGARGRGGAGAARRLPAACPGGQQHEMPLAYAEAVRRSSARRCASGKPCARGGQRHEMPLAYAEAVRLPSARRPAGGRKRGIHTSWPGQARIVSARDQACRLLGHREGLSRPSWRHAGSIAWTWPLCGTNEGDAWEPLATWVTCLGQLAVLSAPHGARRAASPQRRALADSNTRCPWHTPKLSACRALGGPPAPSGAPLAASNT